MSGVTNCLGLPKIEEFLRKRALPSAKTGNILASLEGDAQRICDRKEMYTLPCWYTHMHTHTEFIDLNLIY